MTFRGCSLPSLGLGPALESRSFGYKLEGGWPRASPLPESGFSTCPPNHSRNLGALSQHWKEGVFPAGHSSGLGVRELTSCMPWGRWLSLSLPLYTVGLYVWATITKYLRRDGLQTTGICFSQFWQSKIRLPAWSSSGEDPLLGCTLPTSHCVLTWWKG